MKIKFFSVAALALAMGFASCSNDDVSNDSKEGQPTFMNLLISFETPKTYATADPNATADESKVNKVTVFVFDQVSQILVSKSELLAADFSQSSDGYKDVYTASKKVNTTTGDKLIYVGVNLTSALDLSLGDPVSKLKSVATTSSVTDLTNTTTGFCMFSASEVQANLVEVTHANYANNNTIKVTVERLAVKVSVEKSASLDLTSSGGTISSLQFSIYQSNMKLYRYKYVDNSVVKDPNWDTYAAADFENFTNYVNVNNSGTAVTALNVKYANENTSKSHLQKETTYASVKTLFAPDMYLDGTGASKGNGGGLAKTFWVVITNDGVKNYFDVESEANSYKTLMTAKSPTVVGPYVDGVCYYNAYLNPDNSYNAIRGSFYRVNITKIVPPGNPTPGPVDPEQPVETNTNIQVDFEVLPWNTLSWEQVLK